MSSETSFHLAGLTEEGAQRIATALLEQLSGLYGEARPMPHAVADVTPIPEDGRGLEALPEIWQEIADGSTRLGSPSMMGHMDTAPHPGAALTDAVVSALNNNLLFRELSPFASAAEELVTADLARRLGLGNEAAGTFVSGGSIANLTALFAACGGVADVEGRSEVRLFVPACLHTSITKAAHVLGITGDQIVHVEGDGEGRADPERLDAALSARGAGRNIVVAVLGSTVHGAVEPVDALADIATRHGAWLHVDAIYGGGLAFSHDHRHLLAGLDRAQSVVVAPHKWMYVPRVSAIVYLRDADAFDRRLGVPMPYSQGGGVHRGTWGLQGSRRADAVTLWATLQIVGARRLGQEVDASIARTRTFNALLADDRVFAPTHVPDLNVQCFGLRDASRAPDALRRVHDALAAAGGPWVSLSQWRGALLLRAVLLHPETGEAQLTSLLKAGA